MMRADDHLSRFQRGLLRTTLERGAGRTIAAVTGASLAVSVGMTALSFVFFPSDRETVVVSIALAIIIPLMVAPVATRVIVGLVLSVASINDELEHLAATDSLTGLANRRRFFTVAEDIVTRHDPAAVALVGMVDVDAFKLINDEHGHAAGDAVLTTLADRLRRAVGTHPGVVGRLGGDEFGVVVSTADGDLSTVADALQLACANFEFAPGISARASVGLCCPDEGEELDHVLGRADTALYAEKMSRCPTPRASSV